MRSSFRFDPYHKWLGIPPEEQPPHYYRLLGLKIFEDDPEVIENALDHRFAQVKAYRGGPHFDQAEALLGELANAKLCLLTVEKKRAYDSGLLNKHHANHDAEQPSAQNGRAEQVTIETNSVRVRQMQILRHRWRYQRSLLVLTTSLSLLAVGMCAFFFLPSWSPRSYDGIDPSTSRGTRRSASIDGIKVTLYAGQDLDERRRLDLPLPLRHSRIDFNWGDDSPHPKLSADDFSVKWEGYIAPKSPGNYTFIVYSDDGARLLIDGKLVIDIWERKYFDPPAKNSCYLSSGRHRFELRFFESTGFAGIKLCWIPPGGHEEVVPANAFKSD